jgi:hypothetical protein
MSGGDPGGVLRPEEPLMLFEHVPHAHIQRRRTQEPAKVEQ